MTTAFIGFGSNLGDGQHLILSAWKRLATEKWVVPIRISSLYLTEAVGMDTTSPHAFFTNAVGMVETELDPLELLHLLLHIEVEHGRQRVNHHSRNGETTGYHDRSLDLDLLSFGGTISHELELHLPHPRMSGRLFVLVPLSEIAPTFRDPVTGLTSTEMRQQLLERIDQGDELPQTITTITTIKGK